MSSSDVDARPSPAEEKQSDGGADVPAAAAPARRSLSPERSAHKDTPNNGSAAPTQHNDRGKVYIGNVPTGLTESDVRDFFAPVFEAGAVVESIHFKHGPAGRFGFVHFAHSTPLLPELVAKLNGKEWGGQKLRIEFSRMNGVKCNHCGRDNHRTSECRLGGGGRPGFDQRGPYGGGREHTRYAGPPQASLPSAPYRASGGPMGGRGRSRSRSRSRSPPPPQHRLEFQRGRDFDRGGVRGPLPPMASSYDAPAPRLDERAPRDYDARGSAYPLSSRDRPAGGAPLDLERERAFYPAERERYPAYADRDTRGYPSSVPAPLAATGYPTRGRSRSPSPPPRRDNPLPLRRRSRSRSRSLSPLPQRGGARGRSPPPSMAYAADRRSGASAYPSYPVSGAYPSSSYPAAAPAGGYGADPRDRATASAYPVAASPAVAGYRGERERERDSYSARDVYAAPARDPYATRDAYPRDLPPSSRDAYSGAAVPLSPPVSRDRGSSSRRDDRDRERRDVLDPRDVDPRAAAAAYAEWYAAAVATGAYPSASSAFGSASHAASGGAYPASYASGYGSAAPSSSSYGGSSGRDREAYASSSSAYGYSDRRDDAAAPLPAASYSSRYSSGY